MKVLRLALLLAALWTLNDWLPFTWPFPVHTMAQAKAQAPTPPNQWHPFRGGVNCVQIADANGNFNCSPLVTINPVTGVLTQGAASGSSVTSFPGALVIAPTTLPVQALSNDLVLAKTALNTAPVGPGKGALTLRVRPSTRIPGYCTVVAIAGNNFGQEYPIAFLNPANPFAINAATPIGQTLFDFFVVDIPGGPSGC